MTPSPPAAGSILLNVNVERAYATVLSTVQALAGRDQNELWQSLLTWAVEVVPGAQGGTLLLRFGEVYRVVALSGFPESGLGIEFSEASVLAWYGAGRAAWQGGQPRIATGGEIQLLLENALAQPNSLLSRRSLEHQLQSGQATLCLPIVLGGEVAACINLDNYSSESALGEASIEAAQLYALQATALLAAQREREELKGRIREFEVIETLSKVLQSATDEGGIVNRLAQKIADYLESPHVDILLLDESGQFLQPKASLGVFQQYKDNPVPKGKGLSWASLQGEEVLYIQDVGTDARAYLPEGFRTPSHAQISAPMYDSAGAPLGVIHAARDLPSTFSPREIHLLKIMSNVASAALERVGAVARLERQLCQSRTLLRTVEVLGLEHFEPIWRELLTTAVELVPGAQAGSLWVKDPDNPGYRMVAQQGYSDELVGTWIGPEILTYWFGKAELWQKGLPRIGDQAFIDQAMRQNQAHISAEEFRLFETAGRTGEIACTLCQPIVMNGQIVAYLDLDNFCDKRALGQASVEAAHSFALQVAALLAAQRARSEREEAYEGSLRTIGVALEARDLETAGHTDRVAALALQVGTKLGLDGNDLRLLRWGSYLHDIGKLAVPDSILLKPAKLTPEEFEVIHAHCLKGYRLTKNLPFLPEGAREVVLYHHERWNGRGYPSGLHGENIPLLARIFSVCDVFDALVSKRPYKPAWSLTEAIAEIANQAGEQFDPKVVAAFLKVIRQTHPLMEGRGSEAPELVKVEG